MKDLLKYSFGNRGIQLVSFFAASLYLFSFNGHQAAVEKASELFKRQPAADSLFNMCDVMTGPEVAALSPFGMPLKKAEASSSAPYNTPLLRPELNFSAGYTICHYDLQSDHDYPQTQISLEIYNTAAEVGVGYNATAESWRNGYQRNPEYIPNLGDSACFLGNADPQWCDDCSLQVASGRYLIIVAFKGFYEYEKISAQTKQEAAVNIVKLLFQKKPFLVRR